MSDEKKFTEQDLKRAYLHGMRKGKQDELYRMRRLVETECAREEMILEPRDYTTSISDDDIDRRMTINENHYASFLWAHHKMVAE